MSWLFLFFFLFQCSYLTFKVLNVQNRCRESAGHSHHSALERHVRKRPVPELTATSMAAGTPPNRIHGWTSCSSCFCPSVNLGWNLCSAFSFSLSSCRTVSKFLHEIARNTDALECLKRSLF